MIYPTWVCFDCAYKAGGKSPPGHCCTVHEDTCDVCGDHRRVRDGVYALCDNSGMGSTMTHPTGIRFDCGTMNSKRPLKCPGVGRDKDCISALQLYFSRPVTDDEIRFLHEVVQRAVACMPRATQRPDHKKVLDAIADKVLTLWPKPKGQAREGGER